MDLTLEKPRTELVIMIDRLLTGKPLEEGEELEYIPIDPPEPVEPTPHSTPKKSDVSVAAMLVDSLHKITTEELKQLLSTVSHEMEGRRVPPRSPSKPLNASLTPAYEVSSIHQSLIKEGALKSNISKLNF